MTEQTQAQADYDAARELDGKYFKCIRKPCKTALKTGQHCADCAEYLELCRAIDRELGIPPWQMLDCHHATLEDALAAMKAETRKPNASR